MSLTGIVRPYGDTTGDGRVQVSFTLPVPFGDEAERARAEGAALQLAGKMGLDPAMVVHAKGMGPDFTFFIVYGRVSHLVDLDAVTVAEREFPVLPATEVNLRIRSALGRKLVVVGACIGTDAHTVGIDAILNVKGHAGEKGLEYYREIRVVNMGAQVGVADLVARAMAEHADAVLVSQVVTQRDAHLTNTREMSAAFHSAFGLDRPLLVVGGPRFDPGAVGDDPLGHVRPGLGVPVAVGHGPAQHHEVLVREQVAHGGRRVAVVDVELLDARVGDEHDLPPDRMHGRVGDEIPGRDSGAVDDHRGHVNIVGHFGQRCDGIHVDFCPGPLEPGRQVLQVHRHGDDRSGVTPARQEAWRQLVAPAELQVIDEIKPGRGLRGVPGQLPPAPGSDAAGRVGRQLTEHRQPGPGPGPRPAGRPAVHRAPHRTGRRRCRRPRRARGSQANPQARLGQRDGRGQADDPGAKHLHVEFAAAGHGSDVI